MRLKILYDSYIFSYQRYGGISRYFVDLMENLPSDFLFEENVKFTDNVYLKSSSQFKKVITLPVNRGKSKVQTALNKPLDIFALQRGKYDLFHPTYYSSYFIKYLKSPYVITVHDMIHEKFSSDDETITQKKKSILGANRIIAVSHNTKRDLIDIYGISPAKIDVVYHGYSFNANIEEPVSLQNHSYILFTGARHGYKNWYNFVKAFKILNDIYPDIKLVCTGSKFTNEEKDYLVKNKLTEQVLQLFVSDSQLVWLYKHAICFVYPSLYEGFGIPILEAFASGCPLLLSDTSCFPEIAEKGGLYFNPNDVESMADSMKRIVEDSALRERLIANGNLRLKDFSCRKMAEQTAQIYMKAIL